MIKIHMGEEMLELNAPSVWTPTDPHPTADIWVRSCYLSTTDQDGEETDQVVYQVPFTGDKHPTKWDLVYWALRAWYGAEDKVPEDVVVYDMKLNSLAEVEFSFATAADLTAGTDFKVFWLGPVLI